MSELGDYDSLRGLRPEYVTIDEDWHLVHVQNHIHWLQQAELLYPNQKENQMHPDEAPYPARPDFEAIRNEARNAADAGDLGLYAREIVARVEARVSEAEAYVTQVEAERDKALFAASEIMSEDKLVPQETTRAEWTPSDYEMRMRAVDAAHQISGGPSTRIDYVQKVYAFLKAEDLPKGEIHNEHTLSKVFTAIRSQGTNTARTNDIIIAMQNAGILFRERA